MAFFRSNNLNRTQEDRINNKLQEFLKNETDIGDLCISQVFLTFIYIYKHFFFNYKSYTYPQVC